MSSLTLRNDPTTDSPLGDEGEPALNLIEPRRIGGNEMELVARMARQPRLHPLMLMGRVVVDYQMDVQLPRNVCINLSKKRQELLVPMVGLAVGQHLAVGDVQGRKQRRSPVTDIVVGDPLDVAKTHGQQWLRTLQSLTLALLVHTENQCILGGIQVHPNHIP